MGRLGINHETFITENSGHAEDIVERDALKIRVPHALPDPPPFVKP
jgi:hypothetical protein